MRQYSHAFLSPDRVIRCKGRPVFSVPNSCKEVAKLQPKDAPIIFKSAAGDGKALAASAFSSYCCVGIMRGRGVGSKKKKK